MKDENKTKSQLIDELVELRRRLAELEGSEQKGEYGVHPSPETERKDAEEELKEAKKYAQDIINSSLDMIIAVDTNRAIIEFNEAAQRTFGYSREEVLGKHVEILYRHPLEGLEVHGATKETGQFIGEIANKRKNGEPFTSLLSASILRDTKGQCIGFMGISREMTERKRTEERLRESEKLASMGRLIAGVIHELNDPVSFIYSNIPHLRSYIHDMKVLLNKYNDLCASVASQFPDRVSDIEEFKEQIDLDYAMQDLGLLVDHIAEGAKRTKRIVVGLKAASLSDEGVIGSMDINEDMERTLKLLSDYHRERINIHRDYADLPKVRCYISQLSEVFINLISNACQAIEGQGDIWITTRLEDHTVVISIKDNGVGITKEHIDKIFDPFFTTRDAGGGIGFGLSISHGIIQRHKGQILVDSRLGSGTTFTIRMPVNFEGHESESPIQAFWEKA